MNYPRPESRIATTPPLFRLLGAASLALILLFTGSIQQAGSAASLQAGGSAYLRQVGQQRYRLKVHSPQLDKKNHVCVGERITIVVKPYTLRPPMAPEFPGQLKWYPAWGFPVTVLVTGGTGVTIPANKGGFDWDNPMPGAATFIFIAQKAGNEKIFFEAIGPDQNGAFPASNYAEASLEFEVRDCQYEVSTVSRWSGLGRNYVAAINAAPFAVDSTFPELYSGSGKVTWLVTEISPPPGCPPHTTTFTSSADLSGYLDDGGNNLSVAVDYGQAEGEYDYTECGYRELLSFTPATLLGDVPAYSGGVFSRSQVLADTFTTAMDLPGSADVAVSPKSEAGSHPYQNLGPSLAWLGSLLAVGLILPMKEKRPFEIWKWVVLVLLVLTLAAGCGQPTAADIQSTPADGESTEVAFDPEQYEFFDAAVELAELPGYRATLTLAFDGTRGGAPEQWTRTYEMLTNQTPAQRQLTMESSGAVVEPANLWMAEQDGILYERNPEGGCLASVAPEGGLRASQWEPASFLPGPVGTGDAGSETVNGILARHSTFDEGAIGGTGRSESAGEVWVADQGYIVKYLLTTQAPAGYFGEDVEGKLTYEYNLTDIGQPVGAELPKDCSPGLLHAPLMQDAEDATQFPTVTRYLTPSSIADVIAFYQEQLPGLGWLPSGDPLITDAFGSLELTKDNQGLSVIVSPSDEGTSVWLLLGDG